LKKKKYGEVQEFGSKNCPIEISRRTIFNNDENYGMLAAFNSRYILYYCLLFENINIKYIEI
jgi:hypothetical protein